MKGIIIARPAEVPGTLSNHQVLITSICWVLDI